MVLKLGIDGIRLKVVKIKISLVPCFMYRF